MLSAASGGEGVRLESERDHSIDIRQNTNQSALSTMHRHTTMILEEGEVISCDLLEEVMHEQLSR